MGITLYEYSPSRSARVRWTLLELAVPFESRSDRALFGSDELKAIHPQGKLPAITDDGRPLFESAAICTWLADKHPQKNLVASSGTWERALHDQWTAFVLTEIEAHLWSSARNTFVYPAEARLTSVIKQNNAELRRSLPVLDEYFAEHEYLVGEHFSVTDIIAGFATNWARTTGQTKGLDNLNAYTQRLLARPLCPYQKD